MAVQHFVAFALLMAPTDVPVLRVPMQAHESVVVDGQISPEEWNAAVEVSLAPDVTLRAFHTTNDVLVAVRLKTASPSYVDMFLLLEDGKRLNLHASMQVGERELPQKGWTDRAPTTHWGKQDRWRANAVKEAAGKSASARLSETLVPYDGFEFRLSKERFAGRSWVMRLEVRDFAGKKADLVFPGQSDRFDSKTWARVMLDG